MKIAYPADITLTDNIFKITFTDFEECYAIGETLENAMKDAKRNLSYQLFLYNRQNITPPEPSKPKPSQVVIKSETIEKENELPFLVNDEIKKEKKKDMISNIIKLVLFTIIGFPFYSFGSFFDSVQLTIISFFAVIQFVYVIDDLLSNKKMPLFFDCLLLLEITILIILCVCT